MRLAKQTAAAAFGRNRYDGIIQTNNVYNLVLNFTRNFLPYAPPPPLECVVEPIPEVFLSINVMLL